MTDSNRRKAESWSPTPEQAEYLRATEATRYYLRNLPDDVRRRYAGQWIAAKDCQVIGAARTRAELGAKLPSGDPLIIKLRLRKGVTIRVAGSVQR